MKIGITTVFKAENCGSLLQAWALREQISSLGHEVLFRDYNSPSGLKVVPVIKCVLKGRFKRAHNVIKKTLDFKKIRKKLKITGTEHLCEAYVFGSDTLWNFDDKFFYENRGFFTGAGLDAPCYAYAMSMGSTSKEKLGSLGDAVANIGKFRGIAVRDSHTMDVVSEFYPKDKLAATVDPTLLMKKEDYLKLASADSFKYKKYLLVYYFGNIPEKTWGELKQFAESRGLSILNVGMFDKRYDYSVVSSPENFISAYANAEYVFTNTFHGCVFSTIFNKNFATDGAHKKKIKGFLSEFSLSDRILSEQNGVESVYSKPIDYGTVNELVNAARGRSLDYLKRILREAAVNE